MRIAALPSPSLEVRDLRLVLALLSTGTTARAADVLHLAQPSVSRALCSLEERLGARLFERTSRGLVATDAGERLGERARAMLGELDGLERSLRAPVERRRLRIVCECYTAYHWLPSTLARLRRVAPGIELSLRLRFTKQPFPALQGGDLDAALLSTPARSTKEIIVKPLFQDELLFVVAADHPLASKRALSPDDLRRHPILTAPPSANESEWFLSRVFGKAQPQLDVSTIPLIESAIDLARAGMGIAIVTEWAIGPHLQRGGCVAKRLTIGPIERPWHFAWRREIGDAGPLLLEALQASERGVPGRG